MKSIITISLIFLLAFEVYSQTVLPTSATDRLESFSKKEEMTIDSLIQSLNFESVGPVIMSGRVTDVDVNAENTKEFYVAYASGGVWKTNDQGESFKPLFDFEATMSIGDIAIDWKHDEIIWVGTGENNSSRSSYAGIGVYKSVDKGKTWQNMGLNETNHIGRIVLHPENTNVVWVAAMGHLFSQNPERGVFKTTDGGKTWTKTLFVNNKTGAIDLVVNPKNPDILYAAMWERQAWRWDRHETGANSGIYKSIDGGETWKNISSEINGFPTGEYVGRIGLDIYPENPDILYAYLDNKNPVKKEEKDSNQLKLDDFKKMTNKEFLNLNSEKVEKFLRSYKFPNSITYDSLKTGINEGVLKPMDLVLYKKDTNLISDGEVIGTEIYRTDNGGDKWYRTHEKNFTSRLLKYSYGYYFGEIRVFPNNPDKIIVGGLVISRSKNGGKDLKPQLRLNVHMDHHAFWINPNNSKFILNGNDGGLNLSKNGGRSWKKINPIPVGQFYSVWVDMEEPYNIYGGLQDNGVWMGPSTYDISKNYNRKKKKYPYKSIGWGDGMQVKTEQSGGLFVYAGSQFGNYSRMEFEKQKDGTYKRVGKRLWLKPTNKFAEPVLRFNWQTPILISPHNDSIFYIGAQKLYRSEQKGKNLKAVSESLIKTHKKGDNANGTITVIDESPVQKGLLYIGTDDGLVWITKDNCESWKNISENLPKGYKIYSIDASAYKAGRAYVAMNGYYSDNFEALLFKTEDFGETWTSISANLPMECINKVLEDPKNEKILYVGTDNGLYISIDAGITFSKANKTIPYVAVHDIIVHPRENDLLIGTHGRSIYKVNVAELQKSVR
jgi:photosystem II stability/assembly factor-like uncharacterized protein